MSYNIGQVLYDIVKQQPVIYCGFVLMDDDAGIYIYREGAVCMEHSMNDMHLTYYVDKDDPLNIITGTFAVKSGLIGIYFGVLNDLWLRDPEMVKDAIDAMHNIDTVARPFVTITSSA